MRSKWKNVLWAVSVALGLAALALLLLFLFVLPNEQVTAPSRYVVGEWEGQVAVFEGDQDFPKQVFDSFVSTLPPAQQRQVREGIPVEDDAQLSLLLEDLTS